MAKRYFLKEVANVIFFDVSTNKPQLYFDTLKVSTIENSSESTEARGGQGNGKLMSWDYGRTATLTMQDALLSDDSLAALAGTSKETTAANIKAVKREVLTASGATPKVTLTETPVTGSITVFKYAQGGMGTEVTGFTVSTKDLTFSTGVMANEQVVVFYEYVPTGTDVARITFSASAFPATYKVVGETIVTGEDGVARKAQFIIPKAKLQSSFTMTMDAENVSTFDFNLDVLTDAATGKLYDIVRL